MNKRKNQRHPTAGQMHVQAELRRIAEEHPNSLEIVGEDGLGPDGSFRITIRLPTKELPTADGGLRLRPYEDVVVIVARSFPLLPPAVHVDHSRFAGQPHVLQGHRLCVYLDTAREWFPDRGVPGFLERLWAWFGDAAAARFDASAALYHPVGGVLHETEDTPMIVVRERFDPSARRFRHARLRVRKPYRLDLTWASEQVGNGHTAAVVVLNEPLYFGATTDLAGLLISIEHSRQETVFARALHTGWPKAEAVLTLLAATATRNPVGSPQYLVLAVPNPAAHAHHLLTGRVPAAVADALRRSVGEQGPLRQIDPARISHDIPIEWCAMSDERPEITTRRDTDRPVNGFNGKNVHVWGCGGLGSWMAEFIARAGASRITLCDHGRVTGGLLVRQNYAEEDVGANKADVLAERLRNINDQLVVDTEPSPYPKNSDGFWDSADLLIDATVSNSIAHILDVETRKRSRSPLIAQVATDVRTGTLGIMSVATPAHPTGPVVIDRQAGEAVLGDRCLERFHRLWQQPAAGDEIVPARGCSVPTFHGSSADLAAVAASLVSLLGLHTATSVSGTHLIALPHAEGNGPSHKFIPALTPAD